MKPTFTLLTALLLAPRAALHAADKPSGNFRQLVHTETRTEKWPDTAE